jgi:hypothetical protein
MANKVISSARALIFVVPATAGASPEFLQIVEDLRMGNDYDSEQLNGLGSGPAIDNSLNSMRGRLQWGRVPRMEQPVIDAIIPKVAQFTAYERFNVLAIDAVTGKGLATAVGVLPETFELGFQNGRAARENYRGGCLFVEFFEETAQGS